MGVKCGMQEVTEAKFHPHRCNDKGTAPSKLKFVLLRFDENVEYKGPARAYLLRDFTNFAEFVKSYTLR